MEKVVLEKIRKGTGVIVSRPAGVLNEPEQKTFGFQWHITDRCNLRCTHCYQESFDSSRERPIEILTGMADTIFETLADRSISINLTGGEPLLFPEILALSKKLDSFENLHELNFITNGTVFNDSIAELLSSIKRLGVIKVSLESADESINDWIRGKGNFRRVSENIPKFLQAGFKVVVMLTLGSYNKGSIVDTAEWASDIGVDGLILERFVPMGRGRGIGQMVLTPDGWKEAVEGIIKASVIDSEPGDLAPYKAFWIDLKNRSLGGALCNLGDEAMALMPDGTVYPCRRLPIPVGNICSDPFSGILGRLEKYKVATIREHLKGEVCGMCGIDECAGCRAMAYALTGDVLADDPLCCL